MPQLCRNPRAFGSAEDCSLAAGPLSTSRFCQDGARYAAILAQFATQKTAVWQQARSLTADSARMARGTLRHVDRAMMAVQQFGSRQPLHSCLTPGWREAHCAMWIAQSWQYSSLAAGNPFIPASRQDGARHIAPCGSRNDGSTIAAHTHRNPRAMRARNLSQHRDHAAILAQCQIESWLSTS